MMGDFRADKSNNLSDVNKVLSIQQNINKYKTNHIQNNTVESV